MSLLEKREARGKPPKRARHHLKYHFQRKTKGVGGWGDPVLGGCPEKRSKLGKVGTEISVHTFSMGTSFLCLESASLPGTERGTLPNGGFL